MVETHLWLVNRYSAASRNHGYFERLSKELPGTLKDPRAVVSIYRIFSSVKAQWHVERRCFKGNIFNIMMKLFIFLVYVNSPFPFFSQFFLLFSMHQTSFLPATLAQLSSSNASRSPSLPSLRCSAFSASQRSRWLLPGLATRSTPVPSCRTGSPVAWQLLCCFGVFVLSDFLCFLFFSPLF